MVGSFLGNRKENGGGRKSCRDRTDLALSASPLPLGRNAWRNVDCWAESLRLWLYRQFVASVRDPRAAGGQAANEKEVYHEAC
jgi:hypothetical protein